MVAVLTFITVVSIYRFDYYVKSLCAMEDADYFDSCCFGSVGTGRCCHKYGLAT